MDEHENRYRNLNLQIIERLDSFFLLDSDNSGSSVVFLSEFRITLGEF